MRREFAKALHSEMKRCSDIYLLCGDVGYGVLDQIMKNFPERAFNCGASEQAMLDMAVGLSLEDKIPVVYTITPFLLYRPFESIRLYLEKERIPVKLVGSGRNKDYKEIGFTHFSEDDKKVMKLFSNIKSYWPREKDYLFLLLEEVLYNNMPSYINLSR